MNDELLSALNSLREIRRDTNSTENEREIAKIVELLIEYIARQA